MELSKNEIIHDIGNKLSDFKILTELGRGSYGIVYKVYSYVDGNIYVIKKMDFKHMKDRQQNEAWKEAMILKKINHPHIIKYYNSFLEDDCLCIVMEYAEGGDLFSLARNRKKSKKLFSESELWRFLYEILLGLNYLHSNNIIHRDIKLLNLFLGKNNSIKIGDMGVSKLVSNINALHCTKVGTPLYLSPELIKQIPYDFKVDIWSVGCSMYHMACLEPPFLGDNLIVLGNNIVKMPHKPLSAGVYSKEFGKVLDLFLSKKPELRPSAKDALEHVPISVKENYGNSISSKKLNTEGSCDENNELVTGADILKKTTKQASSKSIFEVKNSQDNNKIILGKNTKDQNNLIIQNLINNNNNYYNYEENNNLEFNKIPNNNNNYNNKENPTSFNIKSALNKNNQNAKTYTNNFFRKDTTPRIISGISSQNLNNNNNNKVVNFDAERKILNINNLENESFENKKNDNNIYKNSNSNGRLSPSKLNSKSKSNLFANNSKSNNNNNNLNNFIKDKDKKISNFNLHKESPYVVKLTDGDTNNNNIDKKDDENFLNEYKLKNSQLLNKNNKIENNKASKSAVNFFNGDSQKKSMEEKLFNANSNNTNNNNNNMSSPIKSSFKIKNPEAENNFDLNFNKSECNEKTKTNKISPTKINKNKKENKHNNNTNINNNFNNSLYNSDSYSPKKTEGNGKAKEINNNYNLRINKNNDNHNVKNDEKQKDNYAIKNTNSDTNSKNYFNEATKNKNLISVQETKAIAFTTNDNLNNNNNNNRDKSKEINQNNIESEFQVLNSNNDLITNSNNNLFKKRIFSSKIRKEKVSNIRPSTANNLGSDRKNIRNARAGNFGSFLTNENLANKILYDINNIKNLNNNNKEINACNNNKEFANNNNLFNFNSNNNNYNFIRNNNNNNLYNLKNLPNLKSEETFFPANLKKSTNANRPFTANIIRNKINQENNLDSVNNNNNNIINININVFNIQNNNNNNLNNLITNSNRFLNPATKANLLYVNEDLKKSKSNFADLPYFNNAISESKEGKKINNKTCSENFFVKKENEKNKNLKNLKPFAPLKNSKIGCFSDDVNLINFNNNLNIKKTAEIIFDNLAKTIGKGDLSNKVLTIEDLK